MRVDDNITIRSDRYCFMVCHDMGMTKFPKGIVAPYHKPLKFVGHFHEMGPSLIDVGASISDDFANVMKQEYEMRECLLKADHFDKYEAYGSKVKFDKDCYQRKFATYTNYHTGPGIVLFSVWTQYLREDYKFGSHESSNYEFCELSTIVEAMKEFKEKMTNDHGVEFSFEGDYPKHLRMVPT